MAQKDIIIPEIKVSTRAVVDIKELYYIINKWASDKDYDVLEKEYGQEGASTKVKLELTRKVDDYTEYEIDIGLSASDLKKVESNKKAMYEGEIEVTFEAVLVRDYEGAWEKKPAHRIMRGFFDKFVMKGKFGNYSKELKEDTYLFVETVRSFLRI